MSRGKLLRKRKEKGAAKAKVPKLFSQAAGNKDQRVANRLVRRARRIAMKFRMSLNPYKQIYCKHCYARLHPGINARVRIHAGRIITYCFECKRYRRTPIERKPVG